MNKDSFKSGKEIEEIENLIEGYGYAQEHRLNEADFLHCHSVLSETLLVKSKRGEYRIEPVGVFGKSGLAYMAVEPEFVNREMKSFFEDVGSLLEKRLSKFEVFYFASLIHLKLAHSHPFRDGNGQIARLVEKWFVAEKLGRNFWKIPSEEYYKTHQQEYYKNIHLGVNYCELDYSDCLSFLMMMPQCLITHA